MSRTDRANSGATPTKPRLAEDPDSLWREIQRVSGGVVAREAGSRLLYPTLRVVGGEDYQLAANGRLQVLVRGMDGVAVREATSQEADDFHEEVVRDAVQVLLLTPPGYASDYRSRRVVRELHSPSGNHFTPCWQGVGSQSAAT